MTKEDVFIAIQKNQMGNLEEVDAVILEPDGIFSAIRKPTTNGKSEISFFSALI